jgi:hypothetical protein
MWWKKPREYRHMTSETLGYFALQEFQESPAGLYVKWRVSAMEPHFG